MYLPVCVVLEISILPPTHFEGLEIPGGGGGLKELKELCTVKLKFSQRDGDPRENL